jgi:hypothetical protein
MKQPTEFQPDTEGTFHGLPESIYRSTSGIANSDLKMMRPTPAHYRAYRDTPKPDSTPAQVFGTLCHAAILEPERISEIHVVRPDGMDYRTNVGKKWRDSQTVAILTGEESECLAGCSKGVASHRTANAIVTRSAHEVSFFRRDAVTGLLLKGRIDCIATDDDGFTTVADIKTCEDASEEAFSKAIANWGYHRQAAYYMDLTGASFFLFIAVEKKPPYAVNVFCLDEETVEIGRQAVRHDLNLLAECQRKGEWPAYGDGISHIKAPKWLH